jgi:hypothetical protein
MKVPRKLSVTALVALTATLTVIGTHPGLARAASATVAIPSPAGTYAPLDISVDGPGTVQINNAALNPAGGHYVVSGACTFTSSGVVGPHQNPVITGFVCTTAGTVHFQTTGQLTSSCPVDGGTLQGVHLTIALDGTVIYDQELWPNPITCWTTAPRQAVTSWSAPSMRFDNSAQARPSASTVARVADASWNYSTHAFVVPAGITCARNLVDINPSRFITTLAERGFVCQGVVAANSVAVVSVT